MEKEITINYVNMLNGTLQIGWSAKDCGFGVLDIIFNSEKDNMIENLLASTKTFVIATENMGEEFAREVLKEAINYIFDNGDIVE